MDAREGVARGRQCARKALELDPELPEANAWLGIYAAIYDYEWQEAGRHFRLALSREKRAVTSRITAPERRRGRARPGHDPRRMRLLKSRFGSLFTRLVQHYRSFAQRSCEAAHASVPQPKCLLNTNA